MRSTFVAFDGVRYVVRIGKHTATVHAYMSEYAGEYFARIPRKLGQITIEHALRDMFRRR